MSTPTITLTGADERTPLASLLHLINDPLVEIGLLYTVDSEGRNRYPSADWLETTARALHGRAAIHVCGKRARGLLMACDIPFIHHAPRIQVNGILSPDKVELICGLYPEHTIITQHHEGNATLVTDVRAPNHALLVDSSGGQGRRPAGYLWSICRLLFHRSRQLEGIRGG